LFGFAWVLNLGGFLRRYFRQDWLTAGQHTGWRCDQPSTINNDTMHIKKVPRTPS
jgi:hypothetical protein